MTSLIKSSYKATKSYLFPPIEPNNGKISWTSVLLLYKDHKNKLLLAQGYVFVGNVPPNIHAYYTNFVNWITMNGQLLYNGNIINPREIYLHFHVGDTMFGYDYFEESPTFYSHYFSSPTNKIYKAIREEIIPDKIKIINLTDNGLYSKLSLKERCDRIHDPRFFSAKRQIYGEKMDHLMYTGLDISKL